MFSYLFLMWGEGQEEEVFHTFAFVDLQVTSNTARWESERAAGSSHARAAMKADRSAAFHARGGPAQRAQSSSRSGPEFAAQACVGCHGKSRSSPSSASAFRGFAGIAATVRAPGATALSIAGRRRNWRLFGPVADK